MSLTLWPPHLDAGIFKASAQMLFFFYNYFILFFMFGWCYCIFSLGCFLSAWTNSLLEKLSMCRFESDIFPSHTHSEHFEEFSASLFASECRFLGLQSNF